jgi:hypothetical protein
VIKADDDFSQTERVVSRDDGYAVVEKLVAQDYIRRRIRIQMDPTNHELQVREEALRILYRLRANLAQQDEPPRHVPKAVELLIQEYEQERP